MISQRSQNRCLSICFQEHLLSYDIETLVIFEKLVHSNDVRVILGEEIKQKGDKSVLIDKCSTYNVLKNGDLIEKHPFLFSVHGAFPEHFDGTLHPRLPLHTHPHFTKCTFAKHFPDPVEIFQTALGATDEVRSCQMRILCAV